MADIASTLNGAIERRSGDATIFAYAGIGLLALLFVIAALLPFDAAPDLAYIPTLFGP